MPPQICDKCNKPAETLLRLQMGPSFASAKCCPACYERIWGKEELEEALRGREGQESKRPQK
jgi:hypothetical protein